MKKILNIILSLIVIIIIAYIVVLNLPQASSQNKKPDFVVSSVEIYDEFNSNEQKANTKYIGKTVEITGNLISTENDQEGATVLILATNDEMGVVLCTLEKEPKKIPEIGSTIKIKGQCNGFLMGVVMNKCLVLTD